MTTPKTIIGGDDVRAIVADCGSWAVRLGSAGEDTPRAIVPCAIGTRPSRKRLPETAEPGVPEGSNGSGGDVVMKDAAAKPDPPKPENKPPDPNAEFVGAQPPASSEPRFRPPKLNAGDVIITSPLAFTDVQPVYDFDRDTGAATVRDWDSMQAVWEASMATLRLSARRSPLFIVEPTRAWSDVDRAHALERAFEGCGTPAAFVARGSAMCAFSAARTTGCVIDVGHQGACAVPIVEGYALRKSTVTSAVGGLYLTERLRDWTEQQLAPRPGYDGKPYDPRMSGNSRLRAHHEVKRTRLVSDAAEKKFQITDLCGSLEQKGLSESHMAFYRLRAIEEMKSYTFRVSQGKTSTAAEDGGSSGKDKDSAKATNGGSKGKGASDANGKESSGGDKENGSGNGTQKKSMDKNAQSERMADYELPDGNLVSLANDDGLSLADQLFTSSSDGKMVALPELAFKAVSSCDVDVRRDLFGGVVVVGGTSLIPGTVERFTRELAVRTPQMYKLKVHSSSNGVERTCGAWIGGSIVASLGTFQQTWVSKAEYDELGARGALRKCA